MSEVANRSPLCPLGGILLEPKGGNPEGNGPRPVCWDAEGGTTVRTRKLRLFASLVGLVLLAAACGDSEETTTTAAPGTTGATTTTAATTTTQPMADEMDFNGDGEVVIGVALAGPRDDGAYYQAVVDGAAAFASSQSWADPIVVDNVTAENAATEIENLAQQGVDIMVISATEIASPMADLAQQYSDTFWYCNCGAGWPESEFYAQSQDDGSEIHYTAGVAAGLMLQDRGGDSVVMIGCCDLPFEKESFLAMQMGMEAVDPSFTLTYVPTGNFPFDFDNTAGATEALTNAVAEGADGVYAYLGGAANPVGQAGNGAGIFTIAAGPSDACERTDVTWDMTVKFDGGDYVRAIFPQIVSGDVVEGAVKVFHVGVDSEPGAEICGATAEMEAALQEAYDLVASGDLNDEFGAIKGEAYAGG